MRALQTKKLAGFSFCLLLSCLSISCSSSKSTPVSSVLQFIAPSTNPIMEVTSPAQSVNVTVNESVTWSLQSGCGEGKPVGSLSNATATSATYTAPTSNSGATQLCTPNWQDVIVATNSSNASASLSVVVVQNPPLISNAANNTFSGGQCSSAGSGCCPVGSVTCCPPASISTIIQPPSFSGSFGVSVVNAFTQIGPFTASGGVPPYTWQMASGALPAGLNLSPGSNSTTLSITGVPVATGCSTFALQLTDADGVASTQGPYTFNVVVIPTALKVVLPSYPPAYNNSTESGDPGVPYAPVSLTTSSGTAPYIWVENPGHNGSSLPAGLSLVSSGSNAATIQGTSASGSETAYNSAGGSSGLYPTVVQVSDSELPYPAVGLANLSKMTDVVLPQPCSAANQATPIQPLGAAINGGIVGGGSVSAEAYVQGSLAFMVRGFDASGPVVIAGSVGVDGNGGITGGEEDVTRNNGSQHLAIQSTASNPGSSYVVGTTYGGAGVPGPSYVSYSRGCMTLSTTAGASTFAFTLAGCSNHWTEHNLTTTNDNACGMTQDSQGTNIPAGFFTAGHIIEFDDCTPGSASYCTSSTRAAGILRWQDSSTFATGLSGAYAFGLSGWDAAAGHYAIAGSFRASAGSISSAAADLDDAGTIASQLTSGSGTYSGADAYGNSTGTLTVGQSSLPVSLYLVSANEALIVTNPSTAGAPIIAGEAITTATSFNNASLQNSQILHLGGVASNGPDVSIGVLTFDGVSSLSGTIYEDQAGTLGTTAVSASYFVDSNTGRVALQTNQQGQTLGAHSFVAYIIPTPASHARQNCSTPSNCIVGFLVGTDSTAQDGIMEFQTTAGAPPPPFSNVYLTGDYAFGTDELLDQLSPAFEGVVYAQPSGASTTAGSFAPNLSLEQQFVRDVSYSCSVEAPEPSCILQPSQALTGSYTVNPNGTGTFGGQTVSVTNGNAIFYIEESPVNLHPSIVVVEQ